ncbi:hypothetical protein AUEXF2481DRAFT_677748 [Aureobasidium subglaciale EXF-2481]|uniref:F-box domain-containing protein n=1 Tax=Aureobasidium subglaciale (strain EXF-2481) TaxID=1043005 RepID=A0A074YCX9_AURSE|nr:uncharacterized protein AUEXF2481DRAFT_677748 [Aureobasidium subglaciale EXF-2481]KEQ95600.1 hypothetical protein AUEXF2481DRAFT_677748 [Aureobasidium subglaciale EXF-2481]
MANILSLANETLDHVLSYVDPNDFPAARSTCRRMHTSVNERFASTYFSTRHHVFSMSSMMTLYEISVDPFFAPFVLHIEFNTTWTFGVETFVYETNTFPSDHPAYLASKPTFTELLGTIRILLKALDNLKVFQSSLGLGFNDSSHLGPVSELTRLLRHQDTKRFERSPTGNVCALVLSCLRSKEISINTLQFRVEALHASDVRQLIKEEKTLVCEHDEHNIYSICPDM